MKLLEENCFNHIVLKRRKLTSVSSAAFLPAAKPPCIGIRGRMQVTTCKGIQTRPNSPMNRNKSHYKRNTLTNTIWVV
eukprot:346492-Amphidinium_carterae.1